MGPEGGGGEAHHVVVGAFDAGDGGGADPFLDAVGAGFVVGLVAVYIIGDVGVGQFGEVDQGTIGEAFHSGKIAGRAGNDARGSDSGRLSNDARRGCSARTVAGRGARADADAGGDGVGLTGEFAEHTDGKCWWGNSWSDSSGNYGNSYNGVWFYDLCGRDNYFIVYSSGSKLPTASASTVFYLKDGNIYKQYQDRAYYIKEKY